MNLTWIKRRLNALTTIILLIVLGSCGKQDKLPRNIILLIGDGMGTNQVYAGMAASQKGLNIEGCEYVGFQKTYSASSNITDSGASGTALACGVKTRNGSIGVDADGKPVKSILEMAGEKGLSTGLLASSTITHATPAAFAAHTSDRGKYEQIAFDMIRSGADVLAGGGMYHFGNREDGLNLVDSLEARGYFVSDDLDDIPREHMGPVAILADSLHMQPVHMGREDFLVRATSIAISRLSENKEGFFLMVEGSQIDWAGHANNTDYLLSELEDFDKCIGKALDFARKDGNTLVIVTADHETGGFSILEGGPLDREVEGSFASEGHTGVMTPVFAWGPGAEEFAGIYENTDIFMKMSRYLNLK